MPVKNIIPGQKVTKEKLERAKELRREMTPAEKILWEELPPAGTFGGRISWEFTFGGSKSFRDSSSIFTVTKRRWLLKWMGMFTIYNRKKIPGGRRLCPRWG